MALFKAYSYKVANVTNDILTFTDTVINDSDFAFVFGGVGDDTLATSNRRSPFATLTKAQTQSNYKIVRGRMVENITISLVSPYSVILGDNEDAYIDGTLTLTGGSYPMYLQNLKVNVLIFTSYVYATQAINCYFKYLSTKAYTYGVGGVTFVLNSFIENLKFYDNMNSKTHYGFSNNTILNFQNYCANTASASLAAVLLNCIFVNSVDLYNFSGRTNLTYYPVFKYCLFRKDTKWLWNGAQITINWTTNPNNSQPYTTESLLTRVYQSLLYYANSLSAGTDKTYFLSLLESEGKMFYIGQNGQSNIVFDDSTIPIFNKYKDGTPVDYTLYISDQNPALTMSYTQSYVGCYKPNLNNMLYGDIVHVDADGNDDSETPDLLLYDGYNQFSASQTSTQLRNRIRTIVLEYPRNKRFEGVQSNLWSGLADRLWFGKRQPMTVLTLGTKLVPHESVEIIPYDSLPEDNTPENANIITDRSTVYPRFSAPFNGSCLMWYKSGNSPLLFSDLSNLYTGAGTVSNSANSNVVTGTGTNFNTKLIPSDYIIIDGQSYKIASIESATSLTVEANIADAHTNVSYNVGVYSDKGSEYADWAVTNADMEDYSLNFKATSNLAKKRIYIKYCKIELNLNYDNTEE